MRSFASLPRWAGGVFWGIIASLIASLIWWLITILTAKRRFSGIIKKINKITPQDFYVKKSSQLHATDEEYINSFAGRLEDKTVREAIENSRSVLILGKSAQGKSREAFQIVYELRDKLKGFWFINPALKRDIDYVPAKKKVIVFLDDLNKYAEERFELSDFLRNFKDKVIVIATCRSGEEYRKACNEYEHIIESYEKIELKDITKDQAETLAQKTQRNLHDFDGTPGSVVLGLKRMKQYIERLTPEQKALLQAIKLLVNCYSYTPSLKVLKGVSIDLFKASEMQFEDNLKLLIDTDLIMETKGNFKIWHDAYLDFIPLHIDLDYVNKLKRFFYQLKDVRSISILCFWYTNNGYYNEGLEICNKAIEHDEKPAEFYYHRARIHNRMGNIEQAVTDNNKAIELDPQFSRAYNTRGCFYDDKKDFDKAIADFTKAIELDPDDWWPVKNRAHVYLAKGDFSKAINDYLKLIELLPDSAFPYCLRAVAYADNGMFDQSFADLKKALEIEPEYARAMFIFGKTFWKQGNIEKAKYWYEQALKFKDILESKEIEEAQKAFKELEEKH
jgi:tetratricopeptide (TPR) repeat protein